MIVQPNCHYFSKATAMASFLCPPLEVKCARLLVMLFLELIDGVPWEENWNYYMTLKQSGVFGALNQISRLIVDEEI